jgi:hypothetical protein
VEQLPRTPLHSGGRHEAEKPDIAGSGIDASMLFPFELGDLGVSTLENGHSCLR